MTQPLGERPEPREPAAGSSAAGGQPRSGRNGITLAELLALPHLRVQLLAGGDGIDRHVSWAQVVDHPSPWDWHEQGDLVMTSGGIVPRGARAQAEFIERLAAAGLSGLALGEPPPGSPLVVVSEKMLQAADRLGFPLLKIAYETSFVEIARLVARANEAGEGQALSAIMRVHNEVRIALVDSKSSAEFVRALGDVVGCPLFVVDPRRWEPVLPGAATPSPSWQAAWSEALEKRGGTVPLVMHLEVEGRSALVLPIPVERSAALFVAARARKAPRLAVLQHVAAACALEIARVDATFERERRTGSALLTEAIAGRLDPKTVGESLDDLGLGPPLVCCAIQSADAKIDRLHRQWGVRGVPHLLSGIGPVYLGLLQAGDPAMSELTRNAHHEGLRVGVSEPLHLVSALGDASRQARWALETVPPGMPGVAVYGDESDAILPRTLLEAEHTVKRVLGPLIDYDSEHEGDLVATLQAYLECERSPKRAAEVLYVHTQTVNYRISRIQELTGRSVRSTADISELWFALRARALSHATPPP